MPSNSVEFSPFFASCHACNTSDTRYMLCVGQLPSGHSKLEELTCKIPDILNVR